MKKVYLDNGSTSFPKAPGVGQAVMEYIEKTGCNINRGGYQSAYSAAEIVLDTREKLCKLFNTRNSKNVIFTPSVTYSLNFIIKGLLKPKDHIIVTSMEHNAVMRPLAQMKRKGLEVSVAQCNEKGELNPKIMEQFIKENTKAIIMLHASNVCGTLLPAQSVGNICEKHSLKFILDTAQTAGVFNVDAQSMKIDAVAFTGHKSLLGPHGIGGFIVTDEMAEMMEPIICGGTGSISDEENMPSFLPDKFEAGTMNLPGIIGLHAALEYIEKTEIDNIRKREMELTKLFIDRIKNMEGIQIVGKEDTENRAAIVSLNFIKKDNAEISFLLDRDYGIMTRCGLHCAPRAHKTLKTFPQGTVRFAFGHMNADEEVLYAADAIHKLNTAL
jgi:cysteine desulfurase family protein